MRCEEFYKEFLSLYKTNYVEKYLTTQCSRSTLESFIVINDNKKKVSAAIFFEESLKDDEKIYAEFKNVGHVLAWNLKTSEKKADKEKITNILLMILKGKHYSRAAKKYFSQNMEPLFVGSNFEKMFPQVSKMPIFHGSNKGRQE